MLARPPAKMSLRPSTDFCLCCLFLEDSSFSSKSENLLISKFDILNERIGKAKYEISMEDKFDFSIINDDLDSAKKEILDLVKTFLSN